jgi:hypothetical protein
MGIVRVTFPDGRTVDGEITAQYRPFKGTPVLIAEGQPYSGLDAINEGLLVNPTDDPLFDSWLNTFNVSGWTCTCRGSIPIRAVEDGLDRFGGAPRAKVGVPAWEKAGAMTGGVRPGPPQKKPQDPRDHVETLPTERLCRVAGGANGYYLKDENVVDLRAAISVFWKAAPYQPVWTILTMKWKKEG